ncbi:MAG: response regulator transcription factor, partial [Lachnospiraceae bacterium]|nr:response regulator transcription factor [Lachnospiraceae bacterium]
MIIEDDSVTRDELTLLLENEGFQVKAVTEFTDVAGQVRASAPQLVLLDLGLPGKDGFTLCMEIRRISQVPILILT